MPKNGPGAQTIRCETCGAAFPTSPEDRTLTCPHCGREQAVDREVARDLRHHRRDLEHHRKAVDLDEAAIIRSREWNRGGVAPTPAPARPWLLLVVVVVPAAGMFVLLTVVVGVPLWVRLSIPAAMAVGAAVPGLLDHWKKRRDGRGAPETGEPPAPPGGEAVRCPDCGADNRADPGEILETCEFCGAALIPSKAAMHAAVDAAREKARQVRLQRFREKRQRRFPPSRPPTSLLFAWPAIPFLLALGVPVMDDIAAGNLSAVPAWRLAVLSVCAAWAVGVPLFFLFRRRGLRRSLGNLAGPHGGAVVPYPGGIAEWLDRCWAGPCEVDDLPAGLTHAAAAFSPGGFEALVVVSSHMSGRERPFARLLLAARMPDLRGRGEDGLVPPPAVEPLIARLEMQGFAVTFEKAGIRADARPETVKRLRKTPRLVQRRLQSVLQGAVKILREIGAQPLAALQGAATGSVGRAGAVGSRSGNGSSSEELV